MKQKKRINSHSRPVLRLAAWLMIPLMAAMFLFAPGNAAAQIWSPTWNEESVQDNIHAYEGPNNSNLYDMYGDCTYSLFQADGDDAFKFELMYNNIYMRCNYVDIDYVFAAGITGLSKGKEYVLMFDWGACFDGCEGTATFSLVDDSRNVVKVLGEEDINIFTNYEYIRKKIEFTFDVEKECTLYLQMSLDFNVGSSNRYYGIFANFKIAEDKAYKITLPPSVTDGSVAVKNNLTNAKGGDVITLLVTPSSSSHFNAINITDGNGKPVIANGGSFDKMTGQMTFTMPYSDVEITPSFATSVDAEHGAYFIMPTSGTYTLDLTTEEMSAVKSFHLYDDGRYNKHYNSYSGSLCIKVPEGKLIRVVGSAHTSAGVDKLSIYDGFTENNRKLYEKRDPDYNINVFSYSTKMMVSFFPYFSNTWSYGLDLTVLIEDNEEHTIDITQTIGGTAANNSESVKAHIGDLVSIKATPEEGYYFSGISVEEKESHKKVDISKIDLNTNTAQFIMPYADVVVTPSYIPVLDVKDGLSFNMPTAGQLSIYLSSDIKSVKLYDDGGKDGYFSSNCEGYLAIIAPEDKYLQIVGSVDNERHSDGTGYLRIFDGLDTGSPALYVGSQDPSIAPFLSTRNTILIFFNDRSTNPMPGFDLTVSLIDNEKHNIQLSNVTGGAVESSQADAKCGDEITITATPDDGYYLVGIDVEEKEGNRIKVNGGDFANNKATFTMLRNEVVVTTKFAPEISTDFGAYINMPTIASDPRAIDLSSVKSFYLYDDGGVDGDYGVNCKGALALTAPEGKVIWINGSIDTREGYDYLYVYDGLTENDELIYQGSGNVSKFSVFSNSNKMLIKFTSGVASFNLSGLDLSVSVEDNKTHSITMTEVTGGSAVCNRDNANGGDIITITTTCAEGYILKGIDVKDKNGFSTQVSGGDWLHNEATFIMPHADVVIVPKFVTELTAEQGAFVNLPTTGDSYIDLSNTPGVRSFYVYDDGGKDGKYSDICDGTLTITAPKGTVMKVSGVLIASSYDNLLVGGYCITGLYDQTIDVEYTSEDNEMSIHFDVVYSNDNAYSGLNLKVTIIQKERITVNSSVSGGTASCELSEAKWGDEITINAVPAEGYYLNGIIVKDTDGNLINVYNNVDWFKSNATFVMPNASVVVTPVFAKDVATKNGAFINMPTKDPLNLDLSNTPYVKSFHLYDDGGKYGDYSENSAGQLVITAPSGKLIAITGSIKADDSDYFYVYDGQSDEAPLLYGGNGENDNIAPVISSGNTILLSFVSDGDFEKSGLDLEVSIDSPIIAVASDDAGSMVATISSESTIPLVQENITVDKIEYDRDFTRGKPSTVMLPFDYTCNGGEGGKFYQFAGVAEDGGQAIMEEVVGINDNDHSELKANTPYIFVPNKNNTEGKITFPNKPADGFVLNTETSGGTGSTDGNWKFVGTYSAKTWEADEVGYVYGFAAKAGYGKDENGNAVSVAQGQFVKLAAGAYCKPMRAYLEYDAISKAGEELPSSIEVVFIDRTATVVDEPDDINGNDDISNGDISTPVSEVVPSNNVKVWSYGHTIYIESRPGTDYRIVDVYGRALVNGVTNTDRDEIRLGNRGGIAVVIINGKTFKLNY